MNYSPTPVKPCSTTRDWTRLRCALGLLAFVLAALAGNFALLTHAAGPGGARAPGAVVMRDVRTTPHSKCGKPRAALHAKHVRPHAKAATFDDDDDDDDDGVSDSFAAAFDEVALPPPPGRAIEKAVESRREPSASWRDAAVVRRSGPAHDARGPPRA